MNIKKTNEVVNFNYGLIISICNSSTKLIRYIMTIEEYMNYDNMLFDDENKKPYTVTDFSKTANVTEKTFNKYLSLMIDLNIVQLVKYKRHEVFAVNPLYMFLGDTPPKIAIKIFKK